MDETIIFGKSLLDFLRYRDDSHALLQELSSMLERGVPREAVNREYYRRAVSGVEIARLRDACSAWFERATRLGGFLKPGVVRFLRAQQEAGARLVLVTGSFRELLEPLSAVLGPFDLIAAPLEQRGGVYTGRLTAAPTIGDGKRTAVLEYAARRRLRLDGCLGIGDDVSDLPFMEMLGAQAVPSDAQPDMLLRARGAGWHLIEVDSRAGDSLSANPS